MDFIICIVSLAIFHPHFVIRIFPSAFYHPHFSIRILSSAIFHPHFVIRIFLSAICHPPSAAIRHAHYRDPEDLQTTRNRDNLEMASLALNKFLILYGTKTNLISKFLQ